MFRKARDPQTSYQCNFKPLKGKKKAAYQWIHVSTCMLLNTTIKWFDSWNLKRISATHRKQNVNRSRTISCNLSLSSKGFLSAAFNPAFTLLPSHQIALQLLAFWFSLKCLQASSAELGKRLLLCLPTGAHTDHIWLPQLKLKPKLWC